MQKFTELIEGINIYSELFTALVGAIFILFRKSLKSAFVSFLCFFKKIVLNMKKIKFTNVSSILEDIKSELKFIQNELKPNGGGSLRDAINRIDNKVDNISNVMIEISSESEIISDTFNIARWSANENGQFTFVNRSFKKLVGAVDDKLCLKDAWISNIVHIDDRNIVEEEWGRAIESGSEYNHSFKITNLSTKETILINNHAKPYFNQNGQLLGWVGVFVMVD